MVAERVEPGRLRHSHRPPALQAQITRATLSCILQQQKSNLNPFHPCGSLNVLDIYKEIDPWFEFRPFRIGEALPLSVLSV